MLSYDPMQLDTVQNRSLHIYFARAELENPRALDQWQAPTGAPNINKIQGGNSLADNGIDPGCYLYGGSHTNHSRASLSCRGTPGNDKRSLGMAICRLGPGLGPAGKPIAQRNQCLRSSIHAQECSGPERRGGRPCHGMRSPTRYC